MGPEAMKRSSRFQDLTGQKFNRLTVVRLGSPSPAGQTRWECVCECGGAAVVVAPNLKRGITKSCGCLRAEMARARLLTHGVGRAWARTAEYRAWLSMRSRCNTPTNCRYAYYGARGINVCERWDSFENFLADMGTRPSPKHSLDRVDVNGNYTPENCRWVTQDRQMQNTNRTVLSEEKVALIWALRSSGKSCREIAREIGTKRNNVQNVLQGKTWRRLSEGATMPPATASNAARRPLPQDPTTA